MTKEQIKEFGAIVRKGFRQARRLIASGEYDSGLSVEHDAITVRDAVLAVGRAEGKKFDQALFLKECEVDYSTEMIHDVVKRESRPRPNPTKIVTHEPQTIGRPEKVVTDTPKEHQP